MDNRIHDPHATHSARPYFFRHRTYARARTIPASAHRQAQKSCGRTIPIEPRRLCLRALRRSFIHRTQHHRVVSRSPTHTVSTPDFFASLLPTPTVAASRVRRRQQNAREHENTNTRIIHPAPIQPVPDRFIPAPPCALHERPRPGNHRTRHAFVRRRCGQPVRLPRLRG